MLSCRAATVINKIDALIGFIDCVANNEKLANSLRFESKRAIAATHLLCKILYDELNDGKHQCPFITESKDKNILINLLDYIVIRGGACRDSILSDKRAINDIDCVVEIHETTQIHLQHLRKYHSTKQQQLQSKDCGCLLWQYYLNKFNPDSSDNILQTHSRELDEKELKKEEQDLYFKTERDIVTAEYLINSRFFMKIICNSPILAHKLAINNFFWNHNWSLRINEPIIYHNVDLNGAEFDFVDNTCKHGAIDELDVDFNDLYPKTLYNDNEITEKDLIEIKIPIYPISTMQCILFYDFTINTIFISFADVLQPINCIDYNWRSKILHPHNKYHENNIIAVTDIYNKILIPPLLRIINEQTACFYFWRLIKISTKFMQEIECNVWKIDEETIAHTINLYDDWVTNKFAKDRIARYKGCIFKFLIWGIKPSLRLIEYENRLKMWKRLQFDKKMKNMLDGNGKFRKQWRWAIKAKLGIDDKMKQDILDLLAKYDINIRASNS